MRTLLWFAVTASAIGCIDPADDEQLAETESYVSNAKLVEKMDLPGMVLVYVDIPGVGPSQCSGTMISDTAVLTAAHCICSENYVGGNVCTDAAQVQFRSSPTGTPGPIVWGSAVFHPDYNPSWSGGQIEHDLAVITIASGARPWWVLPAKLSGVTSPVNTQTILAGFGHTGSDCSGPSGELTWDYGLVTNYEDGGNIVNVGASEFCHGDSGGAIFEYDGSRSPNKLIAVISSQHPVTDTSKAVPTQPHYSWIASHVPDLDPLAPRWQLFPDQQANEIAVSANNAVWITSNTPAGPADFTIKRFNYALSPAGWETMPGYAVRIAVDPSGNAWVINSSGVIWRWSTQQQTWVSVPGIGIDVAIGSNGSVWMVGQANFKTRGIHVYYWNGTGWSAIDGSGVRITVDPSGNPWVVGSDATIWRRIGGVSGYWQQVPGEASDLAIGADGYIWRLGTTDVYGGHSISYWGGTSWLSSPGIATSISVGGKRWVVNAFHEIYRGL